MPLILTPLHKEPYRQCDAEALRQHYRFVLFELLIVAGKHCEALCTSRLQSGGAGALFTDKTDSSKS